MRLGRETMRCSLAAGLCLLALRPAAAEPFNLAPAGHDSASRSNVPMASDEDGQPAQRAFSIEAGTGRVMPIAGIAANVFVADPKIVQVRPASASALFVFGLMPGRTTIAALDASGHPVGQYEITVRPGTYGAASAGQAIARALPDSHITLTTTPGGITINGDVASAADAQEALDIVRSYIPTGQTVTNQINVAGSVTVGLKVRITEMDRQVTRQLGVDWQAMGQLGKYAIGFATANGVAATVTSAFVNKGITVDTVLEALSQDNLVRVLAEPNLTARSGESASFLVGGEYPVPVAQGGSSSNAISITYQQYGVSLSFVPTVLSSGRISLHVRPEVSALATTAADGAVTLSQGSGSLQIPALTIRRAETTIELGSGQSFAIAGLLQDNTTQANNALPGLGEVPVLGALFRSDSYTHNQTELVIIVTPYIVGSVNDPDALQNTDNHYKAPNDIERVLLLRQHGGSSDVTVPGDAGFVVQ
ncbi:type II and III secretion system protein family protein [Lichenicoccus sp.]|uniref:type II and III secretion system protein family protein n=1 Tax=Lichenicoccus sp. TaxID=2781899 RepID=UPI003D115FAB